LRNECGYLLVRLQVHDLAVAMATINSTIFGTISPHLHILTRVTSAEVGLIDPVIGRTRSGRAHSLDGTKRKNFDEQKGGRSMTSFVSIFVWPFFILEAVSPA
jgi:hypothetical protein